MLILLIDTGKLRCDFDGAVCRFRDAEFGDGKWLEMQASLDQYNIPYDVTTHISNVQFHMSIKIFYCHSQSIVLFV